MSNKSLTVTALSDTHNHHSAFDLPGGDILIHAGDATGRGGLTETMKFLDWYADQDYSHIVFVPGNHDFIFEQNPDLLKQECANRGIILLNDSGVEIEGIKIWGSPVQPWFHDWAFNRERGADIKNHWDLIPADTELLITHGPPHGICDYVPPRYDGGGGSAGCEELRDRILATPSIKLHIFGHIHEGRGFTNSNGKLFVNASNLDGQYKIIHRKPISIKKDIDSGEYSILS